MSILLTEQEVRDLYMNEEGDYQDLARAIQLALIEKMRKEPFGHCEDRRVAIEVCGGPDKWRERKSYKGPIFTLPTPQELENES